MTKQRFDRPSEDEFELEIKTRASKIENCECSQSAIITKGPKTYKVASVLQFRNTRSGEISHKEVHFNDYPFRRGTGIQWEVKDRLKHWSCKDDEIDRVIAFLTAIDGTTSPSHYTVIDGRSDPKASELLGLLRDFDADNLSGLISALADRAQDLRDLPNLGETDHRRMVASALEANGKPSARVRHGVCARTGLEVFKSCSRSASWPSVGCRRSFTKSRLVICRRTSRSDGR
ncbi:MAG: hypothetical protein H0T47_16695, partial [Planctomycetaceae bacterium]|nr:hypothetical protein [Planctomycetaceae bacterium]